MPSSSAIQQSLGSLLPTHSAKLPAPLVHLCESLLAQSRQRASHLKPEEEIARAYACCEIACNRLRVKCRLPAVKAGGAPCKPAVYKKLVAFLERVLDEDGIATTPKSTPGGKKRTADGTLKRTGVEGESVTPSKPTARNEFLGKIKTSTKKKSEAENDGEAPSYTMPSIRKLCKTFSTPLLAPHVYTGTCIILKLSGLWPPDEDGPAPDDDSFRETVAGLLTALYIMTLTRMQTAKMTTLVYKSTCARAVEVLEYQPGAKGVEEWIRRINREGYCRGQDWWGSVPEKVFDFDPNAEGAGGTGDEEVSVGGGFEEDEDEDEDPILSGRRRRRRTEAYHARGRTGEREMEPEHEDDDPEDVLLPGLATMMQDFMDLLSGERTRAYETWKKHFLLKLDKLDKTPTSKPKPGAKVGKPSVGLGE
ncbi:uncharacterized protein Z519_01901 [Cladophialophora bantiana CBS 173.52]|uniref:ORC6 first cyclin-like domain-containing protein n=1 Tax=Cladophialophora bantiana (strain ATCC 10958 / CBS 173.52 / CDC B-1940 / NIH 8579) TaxID=1442370 RepID=A0A0D2GIV2_CLAB1|nr:uncharacterized protein Z519_01901 [Cladophialophora bantiana CBS 173.52]KIW98317.1 hypothetical protein Z519_01901 [Cladophialophora bantiana CBS 173.52]